MKHTYKILTLNTWKCDGKYEKRLPVMANGIAESEADIIFLQEDFSTADGSFDTSGYIANQLQFHQAKINSRLKIRNLNSLMTHSSSGLAILSRYPLQNLQIVELPSDASDGQRRTMIVECQLPSGSIQLCNFHLTHLADRDDLRLDQLKHILHYLSEMFKGEIFALGGDFNCCPKSPVFEWLEQQQTVEITNLSKVAEAHQPSLNPVNGIQSERSLDHLFVGQVGGRASIEYTSIEYVMSKPLGLDRIYPSDHAGVILEFEHVAELELEAAQ